ncbi:spore coat protein [Mesobacillus maritimus]|uniref:spore coat protein n=1 Tax=Mesobacillus maritimus TaxID=1643336 RepID=UPI00203AD787|nr:spore coat protein [Mesobacillus maritimus]MCM3584391.1 spore coat protein [Mesobacillus maritimus]MCM3669192.1 spore coat protein [Mesobacillus maritimus]
MNQLIQSLMGMGGLTDQVIATDFLISTKSSIKDYSAALTETATPELRAALREQLRAAIDTHEKMTNYMIEKGYYHPHSLSEQLNVDLTASDTALNLEKKMK